MKQWLIVLLVLGLAVFARADDAQACRLAGGTLIVGKVSQGPRFVNGSTRRSGVWLSHTLLTVKSDDGASYEVAIDNVFANGYVPNRRAVPYPLNTIHYGDRLELCGQRFSDPGREGIHWVHTNCGAAPSQDRPNGWVKQVYSNGEIGANLEQNQQYCGLW